VTVAGRTTMIGSGPASSSGNMATSAMLTAHPECFQRTVSDRSAIRRTRRPAPDKAAAAGSPTKMIPRRGPPTRVPDTHPRETPVATPTATRTLTSHARPATAGAPGGRRRGGFRGARGVWCPKHHRRAGGLPPAHDVVQVNLDVGPTEEPERPCRSARPAVS
jgi:hypothetical protein